MFLSNLLLFASIIVVLALTPGPDVIYITTRGMAQGRRQHGSRHWGSASAISSIPSLQHLECLPCCKHQLLPLTSFATQEQSTSCIWAYAAFERKLVAL